MVEFTWTKTDAGYISNMSYTITKTVGKRWVVNFNGEQIGKQHNKLTDAQNAAATHHIAWSSVGGVPYDETAQTNPVVEPVPEPTPAVEPVTIPQPEPVAPVDPEPAQTPTFQAPKPTVNNRIVDQFIPDRVMGRVSFPATLVRLSVYRDLSVSRLFRIGAGSRGVRFAM